METMGKHELARFKWLASIFGRSSQVVIRDLGDLLRTGAKIAYDES
jgi:predicted 3-demethylubiquinone-9 3-methyltransferase (glyoxalase superfamily)